MMDPYDEQDGEEENEEEEEYELIDPPSPTDLINDEPTEGKTNSGEQFHSGSHPTDDGGDNATIVPDVTPDAAKLMAVRTMIFKEVEQITSTATQSVLTKKTDENLLKITEDDEIDTESTQDDLSSHFTEAEEAEAEATHDNELSHSTEAVEVEAEASSELANDTLTGLQQIDDMSFTAKSVLLRQFSSNTVDHVLREGKLAVMDHDVKAHTEASAVKQSGIMLTTWDGRKFQQAITPCAVEIPECDSFNSKSETTSLTPVDSEEAVALVERERSEIQGVVPCESSAGSDTAKIDEAAVTTIWTWR
ncbi:hypothetical protein PR002_g27802 [Phytophthora rubi]|uniref:Uncharacterized protein n=1 Tax=Phytophthora rubi TaxID=129364 RepID=A0A6A3HGF6_9STRA|nr:hypothetical protein PR002_g27802 [Phytophthora rubi]